MSLSDPVVSESHLVKVQVLSHSLPWLWLVIVLVIVVVVAADAGLEQESVCSGHFPLDPTETTHVLQRRRSAWFKSKVRL